MFHMEMYLYHNQYKIDYFFKILCDNKILNEEGLEYRVKMQDTRCKKEKAKNLIQ